MSDGTMEEFFRNLERILDRPVVDETDVKSSHEVTKKKFVPRLTRNSLVSVRLKSSS